MEPMLSGRGVLKSADICSPVNPLHSWASWPPHPQAQGKTNVMEEQPHSARIGTCAAFVSQAVAEPLEISTLDFVLDTDQMYGLNVYVSVLQATSHLVFPVVYLL